MDSSSKSDFVSKKAATAIIIGIVLFVLAFFGVGAFFLYSQVQQPEVNAEQHLVEAYVSDPQDEPEELTQDEPYEAAEEDEDYDEALHDQLDEHDVHPIVGMWRLDYTTDHVNADMMEYGFVFYWHAYEDGTAISRMYSPHSGWHTIEEYVWKIHDDVQLEEVITYVNIQAFEMYLLGPEHAEMAAEFVGMMMSSNFEIDEDTFTLTMPSLKLVYQRVEEQQDLTP